MVLVPGDFGSFGGVVPGGVANPSPQLEYSIDEG
jgi:hypothetical protein